MKERLRIQGLRKRWILNSVGPVILILVLIGFVDGRTDMYVDIAISYAVLGFITSVIVAKILGGRGDKDGH